MKFIKKNPLLFKKAIELIKFCKENGSLNDYKKFSLAKKSVDDSYTIRMNILDSLIDAGIIIIDNETLLINNDLSSSFMDNYLLKGDKNAWLLIEEAKLEDHFFQKFDDKQLKEIGLQGEKFIVKKYMELLDVKYHKQIQHVSLISDVVGYDVASISMFNNNKKVLLEIKTSIRPGNNIIFYLSRNEYETGIKKNNWFLVFVQIIDNSEKLLGHLNPFHFKDFIPNEINETVRWQSLKIVLDKKYIKDGLP
jgi:hypothetical protein